MDVKLFGYNTSEKKLLVRVLNLTKLRKVGNVATPVFSYNVVNERRQVWSG